MDLGAEVLPHSAALDLKIEIIPAGSANPKKTFAPDHLPILSAIEVIRTKLVPTMKKPPKPTTQPKKPSIPKT